MRLKFIIPAMMLVLTTTPLLALEDGDLAPRGSLLYARVGDLTNASHRLAGNDWQQLAENMLLIRDGRNFEQSEPAIEELRGIVKYFGRTEIAIADVMVRAPYVQMAVVSKLKDGAPTKLSESFQTFMADVDRDMKVTETSFSMEGVTFEIKDGHAILTFGGMMRTHIEDVLDGFNEEALSQTERFQDWNENASGDVVLFADMKAFRNALDRLGEDFDSDARRALEFMEWQKWDYIDATLSLPGQAGGGLSAEVNLYLTTPFERLNALMKPSGGSRLAHNLPAETLGFLSVQLGGNHERTYQDILNFFHGVEQEDRPRQIRNQILWRKNRLERNKLRLEELESEDEDKDGIESDTESPEAGEFQGNAPGKSAAAEDTDEMDEVEPVEPEEWDEQKWLVEQIEESEAEIVRLEAELENAASRPLQLNPEQRTGDGTEAENFHDGGSKTFEMLGLTHEDVLRAIGREFLMGIVGLPDPQPDDDDLDIYEDMWFVAAESGESYAEVKDKILDVMLARKLPDGASEEQIEDFKRSAEKLLFTKVDGGELLHPRGLFSDFCAFGNEQLFGIAANEDVAKRLLAASNGDKRFDTSKLPGGGEGSKYAYLDLGEFLARLADGEYYQDVERGNFPRPRFDIRKYFPQGTQISLSTAESGTSLTVKFDTRSFENFAPALKMLEEELYADKKWDHDRDELYELSNGIGQWYIAKAEALEEVDEVERAKMLAEVTPASLVEAGFFSPQDGLRSAFDPELQTRLLAAWKIHQDEIGSESEDAPANDLSESSFEWFGLPASEIDGHIVCASKGAWACNGYLCLVTRRGRGVSVRWMQADLFNALRTANAEGGGLGKVKIAPRSQPLPTWKIKRKFKRYRWTLDSMAYDLINRIDTAKLNGKEFKGEFVGPDAEDATKSYREFFGLSEDDWISHDDLKSLTIKVKEDGTFTARYEKDGHWLEINEKNEMTASWSK